MATTKRDDPSSASVPASVEGTEASRSARDFEHKPIPSVLVGQPLSAAATAQKESDINPDTGLSKQNEAELKAKGEPIPDPEFKPNQYELNQAIPDPKDAERARAAMGKQPERKRLSSDDRITRIEKYLRSQGAPFEDEPDQVSHDPHRSLSGGEDTPPPSSALDAQHRSTASTSGTGSSMTPGTSSLDSGKGTITGSGSSGSASKK